MMEEADLQTPARQDVVKFSCRLLDSYRKLTEAELIARTGDILRDSIALYRAPMVVVAHGSEADPILCYGNLAAQALWEMSWEQLTATPSRLTAEPGAREDRERLLRDALTKGFSRNYRGVRVSATGRRFWIEDVVVWNILNESSQRIGQAAAFSKWKDVD